VHEAKGRNRCLILNMRIYAVQDEAQDLRFRPDYMGEGDMCDGTRGAASTAIKRAACLASARTRCADLPGAVQTQS
jgi:hypothetical protein